MVRSINYRRPFGLALALVAIASLAVAAMISTTDTSAATTSGTTIIRTGGSTTLENLTRALGPAFEAANTAGTEPYEVFLPDPEFQGSGHGWDCIRTVFGTGITVPVDVNAPPTADGSPAAPYFCSFGQSSREPGAGDSRGPEGGQSHNYHVANDLMIIVAHDDVGDASTCTMCFLVTETGGVTLEELRTIYEIGGYNFASIPSNVINTGNLDSDDGPDQIAGNSDDTIDANSAQWNNVNSLWDPSPMVSRARTLNSGTQPDFLSLSFTDGTLEMRTQNDLSAAGAAHNVGEDSPAGFDETNDLAELSGFRYIANNGIAADFSQSSANGQISYLGFASINDLPNPESILLIPVRDSLGLSPAGDQGYVFPDLSDSANYPMARRLFYMVRKIASFDLPDGEFVSDYPGWSRNAGSSTDIATTYNGDQNLLFETNGADLMINFIFANPDLVTGVDLAPVNPAGSAIPFPPADINLDGNVNILDTIPIANAFLSSVPAGGATRADTNHDSNVNILDTIPIANNFGLVGAGFAPPTADDALGIN